MKITMTSLFLFAAQFVFAQDNVLILKSGGGSTGIVIIYEISPDGSVKKGKGVGEASFTDESKLKKSLAEKYFEQAKELMDATPEHNFPGNLYYSLTSKDKDKESKIVWGDPQHAAPAKIQKLYGQMMNSLTGLTYKPIGSK
jgi:hypothetical protein